MVMSSTKKNIMQPAELQKLRAELLRRILANEQRRRQKQEAHVK